MAHELFHLATWEQVPPEHIESVRLHRKGNPRPEQLANAFAGGLLKPRTTLNRLLEQHPRPAPDQQPRWIRNLADQLGVSGQAMKWRLAAIGALPRAQAEHIGDQLPANHTQSRLRRVVNQFRFGLLQGLAVNRTKAFHANQGFKCKQLVQRALFATPSTATNEWWIKQVGRKSLPAREKAEHALTNY